MPLPGPQNVEDFNKKLKELRKNGARGLKEKLEGGVTRGRLALLAILALLILFFLVVVPFSRFYTDAIWYNHVGFQSLFYKTLAAKILSVVVFGALFFLLLYGNIFLARRLSPRRELDLEGSPLKETVERVRGVWRKLVGVGLVIFSVIAAFLAGLGWGGKWDIILKWINHTDFASADPVFHKNIGYYAFTYPFARALADWLIGTLLFVLVVTAVVYLFEGGIRLKKGWDLFAPHVLAHLSVILAAIFVVKAYSYRLNMYELLFQKKGAVLGVGYTDAHARIPALWIMLVVAVGIAVVLLVNIRLKSWLLPVISVGVLLLAALLAGTVYPAVVQSLAVKPSEQAKERTYLKRYIDATREAYKINRIDSQRYPAVPDLDLAAIRENQATVRNVRLWDPRPMLNAYEQLQSIRQYYRFNDVDVDRYTVDGSYRQTMIAAREMVQAQLPASARTWVNNTLVYTHGFGAVIAPGNDVTGEGNPDFIVSNIPPAGPTNVQIKVPQVYFGELTDGYVVTNTTQPEFDYPQGQREIHKPYSGTGGVKVKGFWRRLWMSVSFADYKLFFSGQVKRSSQIMYYRNVKSRVAKCAPFLSQDEDPYLVVSDDGRLYWFVDCYATTDRYPYSEPTGDFNYIRNSVKAVVDAYNGDVSLYVFEPDDPVISTYRKIFPSIFKDAGAMPEDLKRHVRYPEDFFLAQASVLRTFHMTNPDTFYNREDQWAFPQENLDGEMRPMSPYYVILKTPGMDREETVLLIPFVPHNKQNMISWFAARMDGEQYGKLVNFLFPSGKLVYGPEQIEGRIEQDPAISAQLSLWRQAGSQVIRGNLLVIPIQESLIYVEPLYLQATQIKIPQVKRIVVVYNNTVAMADTLEEAILKVFGAAPPTPGHQPVTPSPQVRSLAAQALDLYERAVAAQKNGDWAGYGDLLNQLNQVLKQLNEKQ